MLSVYDVGLHANFLIYSVTKLHHYISNGLILKELVEDSHDAWEYIIILRNLIYNLFSKFYCKLFILPKN